MYLNNQARIIQSFICTLAFCMAESIQPSCSAEPQSPDLRQNNLEFISLDEQIIEAHPIQNETIHIKEELLQDPLIPVNSHVSIFESLKPFTLNCGGFIYKKYYWLMGGLTAFGIVTNPQFSVVCMKIIPYIPVVACLTAGGLYALRPYAEKWVQERKEQREEERKREWDEIHQKVLANSAALYVMISAETNEMFKRFNAEEDGI